MCRMFDSLFESTGLMPHGFCLLWQPGLLALHIFSDTAISLAYFSIPLASIAFLRRKPGFDYRWVVYLFAALFVLCGLAHLADVILLWRPYYLLDGFLKIATAIVSVITAVSLWPLLPKVLAIPSPHVLESANTRLAWEIDERKHAEAALRSAHDELERRVTERTAALARTEERVRLAVEAADVGFWDYDLESGYVERSHQLDAVLGWNADDPHTGEDFFSLVHPADNERVRECVAEALRGVVYRTEFRIPQPDGRNVWLESRGRVFFKGSGPDAKPVRMAGTAIVITDRVENNERLQASLAEKETLLREVHHRVKNNLQSLLSLIQLEKRRQANAGVLERLNALHGRIQVMASIHKSLYTSDTVSLVEIGSQLPVLCENIRSISPRPDLLSVHVVSDPLRCDLDTAIPLGVLVHEIVTNSVKHAFPEHRPGRIDLSFQRAGDTVQLVVMDDGIGDASIGRGGIGKQLIQGLSEQLSGRLSVSSLGGTTVTVEMPARLFTPPDQNAIVAELVAEPA
jgi:PAS domain S-box-containing protein